MSDLIVHPVVLTGGLQDSKAVPEASDMQELTNFSVFRGRYALRAPFTEVANLTGATQVLAIAAHNNKMYAVAFHGATTETKLWELDDDGDNPVDKGQIWDGAAVPIPTMASIAGGLASVPVNRLYIADYAEQYPTRFWNGAALVTVTEDWDDDNSKENILFSMVATFQYHVFGTNYWGTDGETTGVRPEVIYYSQPGLITAAEPGVDFNADREWWSTHYRPVGKRGDKFRCIGFVQNGMILFKEYETYMWFGFDDDSWQSRVLSPSAGGIGPYASAVTNDGLCFFWAPGRGPHVTDGKQVIDISEDVRKRVLAANPAEDTVVAYSPTDGLIYFVYRKGADGYPQHWMAFDKERKLWSEGEWIAEAGTIVAAGGSTFIPQVSLSGPVAAPSALAIKFLDTFTDASLTDLDDHLADIPATEGWQAAGGNLMEIQGNEVVNIWAGAADYTAQTDGVGGGVAVLPGYEAFCDIEREAVTDNYQQGFLIWGDGTDFVAVFIENIDAANIGFGAQRYSGGWFDEMDADNASMPTIALAPGAKVRLGITIISGTEIKFWWEPAGGGTRTILDLDDESAVTSGGHYILTVDLSANTRMGLKTRAFGAPSQNICNKDNLTVKYTGSSPLTVTALGQDSLEVEWTNGDVAGDTITEIYRDTSSPATTKIDDVASGVEYYLDEDVTLNPDTEYFYRARHKRNGIFSDYSNEDSDTTWLAMPTATQLTQIAAGIKVTYTNNADGADILIYRRRSTDPGYTLVNTMAAQGLGVKTWDDETVTCGWFYFYYMKAVEAGHTTSSWLDPIGLTACGAPELLTCSHTRDIDYYRDCWSRGVVVWTGTDLAGAFVEVQRHYEDDPQGEGLVIGIVPAANLTFLDDEWYVTDDGTQPSKYLRYTLNLREGAADGPIVDTCTTSDTNNTLYDCLE